VCGSEVFSSDLKMLTLMVCELGVAHTRTHTHTHTHTHHTTHTLMFGGDGLKAISDGDCAAVSIFSDFSSMSGHLSSSSSFLGGGVSSVSNDWESWIWISPCGQR